MASYGGLQKLPVQLSGKNRGAADVKARRGSSCGGLFLFWSLSPGGQKPLNFTAGAKKEEKMRDVKVKYKVISYPSLGPPPDEKVGEEKWAEATCPFCGTRCAVFLVDTSVSDHERREFYLSLTDEAECCEHLEAVQDSCLVFTAAGRAEINPFERY